MFEKPFYSENKFKKAAVKPQGKKRPVSAYAGVPPKVDTGNKGKKVNKR